MIDGSAFVHPLACVENASIGARSRVWQFASVIRKAVIGADCRIATCAIVDASQIGDRSIVSHGAFVDPGMRIGSEVFIGPHVIFCNDRWPRAHKDGFDLDAILAGGIVVTEVLDGASIGAGAIVMPGLTIGAGALVAAGAVVTADVPERCLWGRDGRLTEIVNETAIARVRAAHRLLPVGA
jgi:acetyltransferase-like isoleucine patch superfamily enzyme